jgi:hypothetical protein
LALAALMSILTYFEGTIWGEKLGPAPPWLALTILALAIAYTLGFTVWVLRAMKLARYSRLGVIEMVELSAKGNNHGKRLIRCYLENTRHNSEANNDRLTNLSMAHEFFLRTFIAFLALVFLEAICGAYKFLPGGAVVPADPLRPTAHCVNLTIDGKAVPQGGVTSSNTLALHLSPEFNTELAGAIKTGIEATLKATKETPPPKRTKASPPRGIAAPCGCYCTSVNPRPSTGSPPHDQ